MERQEAKYRQEELSTSAESIESSDGHFTMDDLKTGRPIQGESVQRFKGYRNRFSNMLIKSKNLIFRGAPGTGKTYLAKQIAADIISNGEFDDYAFLTDEQKKQVEFVQFHPNYDYSDFVEGFRPKLNADGTMGFELRDGIFKKLLRMREIIMKTLVGIMITVVKLRKPH